MSHRFSGARTPRAPSKVDSLARARPWWQEPEADCSFCLQLHAVGLEVRCTGCDRTVCRDCAVVLFVSGEVFCPHCTGEVPEED